MTEPQIPDRARPETAGVDGNRSWEQLWPPLSYWSRAAVVVLGVVIAVRILAALQNILLIVLAAFVVSLGLQPAIRWLEGKGFRRGTAMAVLILAGLLVGACAVRHSEGLELGLLGGVSLSVAWVARRTWVEWWADASSGGEG